MSEQRLIDANKLYAEISEWEHNVMYKDWVQATIIHSPTVNLEILPIVQNLKANIEIMNQTIDSTHNPKDIDTITRYLLKNIELKNKIDKLAAVHAHWEHHKKHLWFQCEDGEIDTFRIDCGYHNGPECELCGLTFCEYCQPDLYDSECEVGYYKCSSCNSIVKEKTDYCSHCGAKMDEVTE